MQLTLLFITNIFFNALASFLLKLGMDKIAQKGDLSMLKLLPKMITSPYTISGGACFVVGFLVYNFILQKINLNIAYPIVTSSTMILIVLLSRFVLVEPIKLFQIFGILLILVGIMLVVR